jgi:hypothetical protein
MRFTMQVRRWGIAAIVLVMTPVAGAWGLEKAGADRDGAAKKAGDGAPERANEKHGSDIDRFIEEEERSEVLRRLAEREASLAVSDVDNTAYYDSALADSVYALDPDWWDDFWYFYPGLGSGYPFWHNGRGRSVGLRSNPGRALAAASGDAATTSPGGGRPTALPSARPSSAGHRDNSRANAAGSAHARRAAENGTSSGVGVNNRRSRSSAGARWGAAGASGVASRVAGSRVTYRANHNASGSASAAAARPGSRSGITYNPRPPAVRPQAVPLMPAPGGFHGGWPAMHPQFWGGHMGFGGSYGGGMGGMHFGGGHGGGHR